MLSVNVNCLAECKTKAPCQTAHNPAHNGDFKSFMLMKLKLPNQWTPVEGKCTEKRPNSPASLEFAAAALTFIVSTSVCANAGI